MSFQPIVPLGGLPGWAFLKRTIDDQKNTFNQSSVIDREVSTFERKIRNISTVSDMVNDYDVLKVALGAYGLQDDIRNKVFIQRVIEDGTSDPSALANRLADPRYKRFSEAIGGNFGAPGVGLGEEFISSIVSKYRDLQFETEVGNQNDDMRLALNLKREISLLASEDRTADSKWFGVMGLPPVRQVFEVALGLPETFSSLDLDRQLETFRKRSESILGASEIDAFADSENLDTLIENFFVRKSVSNSAYLTSGSIALALLSQ